MHTLSVNNLSKTFENAVIKVHAVNQVNLAFEAGRSYAVIGPSGCGKSTLLNMLGLILEASEGEIFIEDQAIMNFSPRKHAQLRNQYFGYVDQHYLLIEEQTVYENLTIPFIYSTERLRKKERLKRVQSVLEKVSLEDKLHETVKNLSGGQKQRVAIARAIINDATVILADEPTAALDNQTGQQIIDLLLSLVDSNKTLIMVTHNPQIAERCDDIISMKDGYLINEH